ncbi:MAG: HD domain-containing protein [Candidatus Methanoplasma sp.]|jgi:hypothetical protein|nr:HD domain-containing protein [Candidatus Methanoplasma sp.]
MNNMADVLESEKRVALYRHLTSMQDTTSENFFERYPDLRYAETVAREVLPYYIVNNWSYTLHDFSHSVRVIMRINEIVDMLPIKPNDTELRIVYLAAWYHDLGMVLMPRSKEKETACSHGEVSEIIVRKMSKEWKIKKEHVNALCNVIKYHGREFGFEKAKKTVMIEGEVINLRRICALFCLCDILDMGRERVSRIPYELFTDERLMVKLSDIIGGHAYPYIHKAAREHWIDNFESSMTIKADRKTIVIGCGNEKQKNKKEQKVRYARECLNELGLTDVSVELVIDT